MSLTLQDLYDQMVAYFSREDAVIARENFDGTCLYRTEQGNKCAVGCLIPDANYRGYFEQRTYDDLVNLLGRFDQDVMENMIQHVMEATGAYPEYGDVFEWAFPDGFDVGAEIENARAVYSILDDDPLKREFLSEAQMLHDRGSGTADVFLSRLKGLASKEKYGLKV